MDSARNKVGVKRVLDDLLAICTHITGSIQAPKRHFVSMLYHLLVEVVKQVPVAVEYLTTEFVAASEYHC